MKSKWDSDDDKEETLPRKVKKPKKSADIVSAQKINSYLNINGSDKQKELPMLGPIRPAELETELGDEENTVIGSYPGGWTIKEEQVSLVGEQESNILIKSAKSQVSMDAARPSREAVEALDTHVFPVDISLEVQSCRSVESYEKIERIDEGTYGVVYLAREISSGSLVALKRLKPERNSDGLPISTLREISILCNLRHPNIIAVTEVVVGEELDSVFMVMEYMDYDLRTLMSGMDEPFMQAETKSLLIQLLSGVAYLHRMSVIHRDLKYFFV
jgi:cell division cycle 2-like protein